MIIILRICGGVFLFYCSPLKWTKRKGKNEIFIFRFSLCASRTRESLLDVSQTSNKKEKPQNFQNKKRNSNLKFFLSQSMDPDTALELVKQGVTLFLLDVPQYTLLGFDTQLLLLILYSSSFFCLLLLIIYSSINQSMWQMFSVGPAFKGIKMIPPASHFLYYSSSTRLL